MNRFARAIRIWPLMAVLALVILWGACSAPAMPSASPLPPTPTEAPMEMATETPTGPAMDESMSRAQGLVSGWYQGGEVKYYDFGSNTPLNGERPGVAPIFAFIHGTKEDGSPDFVQGQHNIVDVVPGDAGYSDLWQVFLVTVPKNYAPDSIRSKADLDQAGYAVAATSIFVNCPIVPEGTRLEGGEELTQGWYQGQEVFYPDFGPNPVSTAPIWAFITGMDAAGNPQFVEGQRNIIDVVPGDTGYSAFWRVNLVPVPEGYSANTIRSASEVMNSGYEIMPTDILVNCPVVPGQT